jgi:hypothetical protein
MAVTTQHVQHAELQTSHDSTHNQYIRYNFTHAIKPSNSQSGQLILKTWTSLLTIWEKVNFFARMQEKACIEEGRGVHRLLV